MLPVITRWLATEKQYFLRCSPETVLLGHWPQYQSYLHLRRGGPSGAWWWLPGTRKPCPQAGVSEADNSLRMHDVLAKGGRPRSRHSLGVTSQASEAEASTLAPTRSCTPSPVQPPWLLCLRVGHCLWFGHAMLPRRGSPGQELGRFDAPPLISQGSGVAKG